MTFGSVAEGVGLARVVAGAGLPLSLSFLVDAQTGEVRPDFYGINCAHPDEFAPALADEPWMQRVRSLRPNAAMAEKQSSCRSGHLVSGDPEALGAQIGAIARRFPHLDVFGGCCGTFALTRM